MIKNFIIYKDFHKCFLEGIQRKNAHELRSLDRYLENNGMNTYSSSTDLSEDDYLIDGITTFENVSATLDE